MKRKRREYLSLLGLAAMGAVSGCAGDPSDDQEIGTADGEGEGRDETTEVGDATDATEESDDTDVTEADGGDDASASEYVDEIDEQVVLAYGETAHVSNGVNVTAHGITVYDQMGDEQPEERDAFAVLEVDTENTSDEQRYLPDATGGWEVFYGDQQVSQTFNSFALDAEDYTQLEGGDVQGGVAREGVILFEVDDGFGGDEIDSLWYDNFQLVEEIDQSIDVRWTTNP